MRLDAFVAGTGVVVSRSQAKALIERGYVLVEGRRRKASYVLRPAERVEVTIPPAPPVEVQAEPLDLPVIYEDSDIIAVNKPPGMIVHPAAGRRQGTLVNALLYRWGSLAEMGGPRPGIVHRLDKDTSGLMVVAKGEAALEGLARQFRDRTVEKCYLALVRGVVPRDSGRVDLPIGRHRTVRHKMSVRSRRSRAAMTRYRVKERFEGATLLELWPQTGRTHQIRVHMAAIGFPVLGDRTYGRKASFSELIGRQALHALSLSFDHPRSGLRLRLQAPLWEDMAAALERLRAEARKPR